MEQKRKFVQLGLRKKGRIVKNEQYSIKKFIEETLGLETQPAKKPDTPSFWERLSKYKTTTAIQTSYERGESSGYQKAIKNLKRNIGVLIDQDKEGRK